MLRGRGIREFFDRGSLSRGAGGAGRPRRRRCQGRGYPSSEMLRRRGKTNAAAGGNETSEEGVRLQHKGDEGHQNQAKQHSECGEDSVLAGDVALSVAGSHKSRRRARRIQEP